MMVTIPLLGECFRGIFTQIYKGPQTIIAALFVGGVRDAEAALVSITWEVEVKRVGVQYRVLCSNQKQRTGMTTPTATGIDPEKERRVKKVENKMTPKV